MEPIRSCHRRTRYLSRAASVVFLGVLAQGALQAAPSSAASASSRGPQSSDMATDLLRHLIAINSTHARGSTAAAHYIADRLAAGGFEPGDIHVLAPDDHPDKGNIVVRYRGHGKGKPLLYLCHLDVVEAKREDWSFDPFVLTERDGWFYGRGTIDMKGQDAAVITALINLRAEGYVPARDIIVAFTADEEAGGNANGVQWLLDEHRDLIDAGLVVNPDGGEAGMKSGRNLYVALQTSEKYVLTFSVEATDKGGHSSRPTAANPIYRLARALDRVSQFTFPLHLTDTTRAYFAGRAQLAMGPTQQDMRGVLASPPDPAAVSRLSADVETNIMLRTTCTATLIEGGHAENALPQRARASIQCRVIPGETPQEIQATLERVMADPLLAVSVQTAAKLSPESKATPAILAAVTRVVHSIWPEVIVLPEMSAGADDSIYARALGIPAFGIDGMFDDLDDGRAHGKDERIGVQQFADEQTFTYRLMKELSRAP